MKELSYVVMNADFDKVAMMCYDYEEAAGWVAWLSEEYKNDFYIEKL